MSGWSFVLACNAILYPHLFNMYYLPAQSPFPMRLANKQAVLTPPMLRNKNPCQLPDYRGKSKRCLGAQLGRRPCSTGECRFQQFGSCLLTHSP